MSPRTVIGFYPDLVVISHVDVEPAALSSVARRTAIDVHLMISTAAEITVDVNIRYLYWTQRSGGWMLSE